MSAGREVILVKDILLTGNTKYVTNAMLAHFGKERRIILCGDMQGRKYKNPKVITYSYHEYDDEYRGIYKSYNIDTVVQFSKVLDGQKRMYDEIENLENALYCSKLGNVKNFIYITSNDYLEGPGTTRSRLLFSCEDICRGYAEDSGMNVIILRVPYLFSVEPSDCTLTRTIRRGLSDKDIELSGSKETVTDFLSDEDLGELLSRIMDDPLGGYHEADVGGGSKISFAELGELLKSGLNVSEVKYDDYKEAVPGAYDDGKMRIEYGWFAKRNMAEWLRDIIKAIESDIRAESRKKRQFANAHGLRAGAASALEMIFMFAVSELLTYYTSGFYRMDYVDFRLLFVVIMGTVHGTRAGITASALAGIGYFSRGLGDTDWQIIFFNIENWLPFVSYFLCGSIVGHIRDKTKEYINFSDEQQKILENKYIFLGELYAGTLENKENYSRQIVSYEDSFGKIYRVVCRLNSTVTDKVFYEAVNAMEEILEVNSVAIYSIAKDSHFARLNVCSRQMNGSLAKSVDLQQFPQIWKAFKEKRSWYNAEGMADYPAYAAPVMRDGSPIGAILLWKASSNNMKMDYYNKFNIICGLVQDALVRAIEYNEREEGIQMEEGTRFLKPEYFENIAAMKERLGKDGMTNYMLLRIHTGNMNLGQISEVVSRSIRNTDVLGLRKDNSPYLLLSQADKNNFKIVNDRLKPKGISLERVSEI